MTKRIIIVVFPVLAVGVGLAIRWFPVRESEVPLPHMTDASPLGPAKMSGSLTARPLSLRYPLPNQRNATPAESNAVRMAYLRITEAYTNGTIDELKRRIDEMPGVQTNMYQHLHGELSRPLGAVFGDRFLWNDRLADFGKCPDFEHYVEANLLVAKFMGNTIIRRGEFDVGLGRYDDYPLYRLRCYRDKFEREGRMDLLRAADRFIEEWIGQIESEFGFTRWLLWHWFDLEWFVLEEEGLTQDELLKLVRSVTAPFRKTRYVPKWIDEFREGPDFKWKYLPSEVK